MFIVSIPDLFNTSSNLFLLIVFDLFFRTFISLFSKNSPSSEASTIRIGFLFCLADFQYFFNIALYPVSFSLTTLAEFLYREGTLFGLSVTWTTPSSSVHW